MSKRPRRLAVRSDADREISRTAVYLEAQEDGLSERVFAVLDSAYAAIRERPESFPLYYRDIRKVRLVPSRSASSIVCRTPRQSTC